MQYSYHQLDGQGRLEVFPTKADIRGSQQNDNVTTGKTTVVAPSSLHGIKIARFLGI